MTFFLVFAAVLVGGAAATFGGATAAAPKGNLHQTLPHNSASKFCASSPLLLNYRTNYAKQNSYAYVALTFNLVNMLI